jgi:WD40 repeat protein
MFDIRNSEPVFTIKAHEASVSSMAMSSEVPNLLVTGSEEENIKIWDIKGTTIDLVHEKKFKIVRIVD